MFYRKISTHLLRLLLLSTILGFDLIGNFEFLNLKLFRRIIPVKQRREKTGEEISRELNSAFIAEKQIFVLERLISNFNITKK